MLEGSYRSKLINTQIHIYTLHDTKRSYILVQNLERKQRRNETRKHMKSGKGTVLETKSRFIVSFDWMTEKYRNRQIERSVYRRWRMLGQTNSTNRERTTEFRIFNNRINYYDEWKNGIFVLFASFYQRIALYN